MEYGAQWEKISAIVGRASGDCRDRYRNHLENEDKRQNGPWTKEEEEELTKIVLEMTLEQGKDIDNDVFWGIVSHRMGNRRGRQQVRIKWYVIIGSVHSSTCSLVSQDRFAQQPVQKQGSETAMEPNGLILARAQVCTFQRSPAV